MWNTFFFFSQSDVMNHLFNSKISTCFEKHSKNNMRPIVYLCAKTFKIHPSKANVFGLSLKKQSHKESIPFPFVNKHQPLLGNTLASSKLQIETLLQENKPESGVNKLAIFFNDVCTITIQREESNFMKQYPLGKEAELMADIQNRLGDVGEIKEDPLSETLTARILAKRFMNKWRNDTSQNILFSKEHCGTATERVCTNAYRFTLKLSRRRPTTCVVPMDPTLVQNSSMPCGNQIRFAKLMDAWEDFVETNGDISGFISFSKQQILYLLPDARYSQQNKTQKQKHQKRNRSIFFDFYQRKTTFCTIGRKSNLNKRNIGKRKFLDIQKTLV